MMQINNLLQDKTEKVERVIHLIHNTDPTKIVAMIASLESEGEVNITNALRSLLQESLSSQ